LNSSWTKNPTINKKNMQIEEKGFKEGKTATLIENTTGKIPSDFFLWGAAGAVAASLTLKIMRKEHASLLLGQWVAPLLLLGVYNKIVKVAGHDQDNEK
jgi:hypothetical protein